MAEAVDDGTGRAQRAKARRGTYPHALGVDPCGPLPSAFWQGRPATGVERLCWAVLDDALACACGTALTICNGTQDPMLLRARLRQTALDWIASERRDWPFAFREVCDVLDMDAGRIRAYVADGPRHHRDGRVGGRGHLRLVRRLGRAA